MSNNLSILLIVEPRNAPAQPAGSLFPHIHVSDQMDAFPAAEALDLDPLAIEKDHCGTSARAQRSGGSMRCICSGWSFACGMRTRKYADAT